MLKTLQVGLDLAGLIPGFGEIADGLNAAIYYARGDKVNAALSLRAMIPFAGMAATGGKLINKGAKAVNGIVDGVKTVANKGSIGKLTEKANKQLNTVKDKLHTKVDEVKNQLRQMGTPPLELAGVNVGRITDTGTVGKNKPSSNPKPSNSSKPPAKDSKSAEATKGTGNVATTDSRHDFVGKLKGEEVKLPNVKTEKVTFNKRTPDDTAQLRKDFNMVRKDLMKSMADNPEKLKKAGISDNDIEDMMEYGLVPDGWQVHHKIPLDPGGTNDVKNLVLIKNHPYHKVITNEQNSLTRGMKPGESKIVDFPILEGDIYPPKKE